MTRRLRMVLTRILNIPLFLLTRLTPRDPHLWVFGAWFGQQYADNPRYLAEYIAAHRPDLRPVWLAESRVAVAAARGAGLTAYRTFSPRGYLVTARAAAGVICTSSWDINHFVRPPVVLNTWHGNPLKKVGKEDEKRVVSPGYALLERAIPMFGPGSFPVLVSSRDEQEVMERSFGQPTARVLIAGYPRNDVLGRRPVRSEGLKIIYMPTHRGEGKGEVVSYLREAAPMIERRLAELGATLFVKLHYYHSRDVVEFASPHIVPVSDAPGAFDTHRFLDEMDVLITDYSSILFDWLLTGRPLVLFPYDLEAYQQHDRSLNWAYDSIAAGPQCRSWTDVISALEDIAMGDQDRWEVKRAKVRSRFHAHDDRQSSARVVALLEDMIADGHGGRT